MARNPAAPAARVVRLFTEYAADEEQDTQIVIPTDLSSVSDADLSALHTDAVAAFDTIYADGQGLDPEALGTLEHLAEGVEALASEIAARAARQVERDSAAQALASRVRGESAAADSADSSEPTAEVLSADAGEQEPQEPQEPGALSADTAAAPPAASVPEQRPDIRINLSAARSRQTRPAPATGAPSTISDLVLAADVPGFSAGQGLDWDGVGRAVDRRLSAFNISQYDTARRNGTHLREQHSVAVIRKPFQPEFVAQTADSEHVDAVMARAADQSRLPGGSLVASGGWCAPSETLYDFLEPESRDGIISIPEIQVNRGGIKFTTGVDFSTIYEGTGFEYTEAQDEGGLYGEGGVAGDKPCFTVPCPTFSEERLSLIGLCISAGLLQSKGYPEVIARTVRGALVAHDHRIDAATIAKIIAGSTPVTMTSDQVGTAAPVLDAIELQVTHYRYTRRLPRNATLEGIFPAWVHGAVRSDLARRQGMAMLSVSDAQITSWFAERGVSAQFSYNLDPVAGTPGSFVAWPSTFRFVLYLAGTWVRGTSDVITLDTIYDSVQLAQNDYTALFTEEGMLVAKRFPDSRVVTVPVCSTGMTGGGIEIACDGTAVPAPGQSAVGE